VKNKTSKPLVSVLAADVTQTTNAQKRL